MSDLIVKAAVKDALSDHNVSADFYDAPSTKRPPNSSTTLPACRSERPEDGPARDL